MVFWRVSALPYSDARISSLVTLPDCGVADHLVADGMSASLGLAANSTASFFASGTKRLTPLGEVLGSLLEDERSQRVGHR